MNIREKFETMPVPTGMDKPVPVLPEEMTGLRYGQAHLQAEGIGEIFLPL